MSKNNQWQLSNNTTATSGGVKTVVNNKLTKKLRSKPGKSDDLKEALKTSNTFPGVSKPPACAELHTRPGERLVPGWPQGSTEHEVEAEAEMSTACHSTVGVPGTGAAAGDGGLAIWGLKYSSPTESPGDGRGGSSAAHSHPRAHEGSRHLAQAASKSTLITHTEPARGRKESKATKEIRPGLDAVSWPPLARPQSTAPSHWTGKGVQLYF